jgi:GTPase SAR1 family protein
MNERIMSMSYDDFLFMYKPKLNISYDCTLKIGVVGKPTVGKHSLICNMINSDIKSYHWNGSTELDSQITTKEIRGRKIKYQLWNLFMSSTSHNCINYTSECSIIILVIDLTDTQSLDMIDKDLSNIKKHIQKYIPIFLVGIKENILSEKQITDNQIRFFCRQNDINYIEVISESLGYPMKRLLRPIEVIINKNVYIEEPGHIQTIINSLLNCGKKIFVEDTQPIESATSHTESKFEPEFLTYTPIELLRYISDVIVKINKNVIIKKKI